MALIPSFFLFFSSSLTLVFFTGAGAQGRAPHGLVYENPVAFSPSAVEFFHPKTHEPNVKSPCAASSSCSPLPLAAQLEATDQAQESEISTSQKGGNRLRAGGIAGIVLGVAFAVLLTMGVYHVMVTRKANLNRANSVQTNAWCDHPISLNDSHQLPLLLLCLSLRFWASSIF